MLTDFYTEANSKNYDSIYHRNEEIRNSKEKCLKTIETIFSCEKYLSCCVETISDEEMIKFCDLFVSDIVKKMEKMFKVVNGEHNLKEILEKLVIKSFEAIFAKSGCYKYFYHIIFNLMQKFKDGKYSHEIHTFVFDTEKKSNSVKTPKESNLCGKCSNKVKNSGNGEELISVDLENIKEWLMKNINLYSNDILDKELIVNFIMSILIGNPSKEELSDSLSPILESNTNDFIEDLFSKMKNSKTNFQILDKTTQKIIKEVTDKKDGKKFRVLIFDVKPETKTKIDNLEIKGTKYFECYWIKLCEIMCKDAKTLSKSLTQAKLKFKILEEKKDGEEQFIMCFPTINESSRVKNILKIIFNSRLDEKYCGNKAYLHVKCNFNIEDMKKLISNDYMKMFVI